jgi:hypothetical protein
VRRSAPVVLVLALALACSEDPPADCPGEPVATFRFQGTLVAAGDARIAGFEPTSTSGTFDGTLSADPASSAAALCRTPGTVLYGPRTGDGFVLETSTDGAVLGEQCAPTCSAELRLVVAGDVARAGGEAVSFAGVLVEVMSAASGSACGACTLPCAARYALAGTP